MIQNQSIVILHGWGVESERYKSLKQLFEKKAFKVYLPELPMDREYTIFDYEKILLNFIKNNNIKKPILLGHSFGGRISLVAVSKNPDKFTSLILTGVPGYNPVPSIKKHFFYVLAKMGKLLFILPPLSFLDKLARKLLYFFSGSFDYYKTHGAVKQTFINIIKTNLDPFIKNINIPTLLLWGENDHITPVWIAKKMNKNIKSSKLVIIPKEDHSVVYKNPSLFTKYVL